MKPGFACLSFAAFALVSCDKSREQTQPAGTSTPPKTQVETKAAVPKITPPTAPAQNASPQGGAPAKQASEPLTAEQTIATYKSNGIPGIPRHISDKILADAAKTESYDDQLNIITQQTAAWRHINTFSESDGPIPEHMRRMLLERLYSKHGDSWINMVPELDEQIAASAKVDQLRANGIPGLSEDESQELIISAMVKYGPDYKAIVAFAEQAAKK